MARHRGRYQPQKIEPYELSRSRIESWLKCEGCFWLDRVRGVKFPSFPPFNINSLTDKLLKREFDEYRGKTPIPWITEQGWPNLIPYDHANLENWTDSLHFGSSPDKFNTIHKETNILFGGGIDDMMINRDTEKIHLVDFKSTAQLGENPSPINLEGKWKQGYKRQMDMYLWIGKRKGLPMSNDCFFLYVDGKHEGLTGMGLGKTSLPKLEFTPSWIHYAANDEWVEPTLFRVKETLHKEECPSHDSDCEYALFLNGVKSLAS